MKSISSSGVFKQSSKIITFIVMLILLVSFVSRLNPFIRVEYGTMGVVDQFGKINRLVGPGLHLIIPVVENVRLYTTQKVLYQTEEAPSNSDQIENIAARLKSSNSYELKQNIDAKDFPVDTSTADGQQISIRYTVRYSINPDQLLKIAETIGTQEQVAIRIVQAQSRSVARNIAREFTAQELYTGNVFKYQQAVFENLKNSFAQNGVVLDEFLVRQIQFSPEYITAVEQKQIQSEQVKTEEFIAQQEEFKKQQKIIKAEGEAKAQEILTDSLNAEILEKQAIEKWDGKLPTYLGGSGDVPFINIR